jgi:hypothetical protein
MLVCDINGGGIVDRRIREHETEATMWLAGDPLPGGREVATT